MDASRGHVFCHNLEETTSQFNQVIALLCRFYFDSETNALSRQIQHTPSIVYVASSAFLTFLLPGVSLAKQI